MGNSMVGALIIQRGFEALLRSKLINNMETIYHIEYSYRTGDSFGTQDHEDVLEYEWNDLEKAKESLARIKEHYTWYESKENHYGREKKVEEPSWHKISGEHAQLGGEHCILNIPMDNGNEVQFWPPWCGYFESLYGASIVSDEDDDMSFQI